MYYWCSNGYGARYNPDEECGGCSNRNDYPYRRVENSSNHTIKFTTNTTSLVILMAIIAMVIIGIVRSGPGARQGSTKTP